MTPAPFSSAALAPATRSAARSAQRRSDSPGREDNIHPEREGERLPPPDLRLVRIVRTRRAVPPGRYGSPDMELLGRAGIPGFQGRARLCLTMRETPETQRLILCAFQVSDLGR